MISNNITSTESDVNTHQGKVWAAIDMLSIKWKSDLSDKIKHNFFQAVGVSVLLYGCISWTQKHGEKARWELHKNAICFFEQILEVVPFKTAAV